MNILEHTIRNILIAEDKKSLYKKNVKEEEPKMRDEETVDEMSVNTNTGGTMKGSQFASAPSRTVTPTIRPGHNEGAEKAANARNAQKAKTSETMIKNKTNEEIEEESGSEIRKKVENVPRSGQKRKELEYVGRKDPNAYTRHNEIMKKIIDESKRNASIIKNVVKKGNTDIDNDPKELKQDSVSREVTTPAGAVIAINPQLKRDPKDI